MTSTLSPKLIGQTEKTLNAILQRIVGDRVSEPEWVALVALSGAGEELHGAGEELHGAGEELHGAGEELHGAGERLHGTDITAIIAAALKLQPQQADGIVRSLTQRGLLETGPDGAVRITTAGRELLKDVRSQTEQVTQRLWGDLPEDELTLAGNVLTTVLERAERELRAA
jgi:DNA-binding MarR family transcriptional regulator